LLRRPRGAPPLQALDTPRLARLSAPGGGAKLPLLYRIAVRIGSVEGWRSFLAVHGSGVHAQTATREVPPPSVEVGGEGGQKRFWLQKRRVSRDLLIGNQRVCTSK